MQGHGTPRNLPLGDGYVVTDYYCQGASFKKDPWLSHLSVPPTGPLSRASLYVVTSWHAEWGDVRLLTPLWVEGERGWSEQRRKVIDTFHKAARMDNSLRLDLPVVQA